MTTPDDFNSPADRAAALRLRAEAQLSTRGVQDLGSLHELQVHQIELEMQNEELRRTQEALERAHTRYFDLYDLAPVGYLTLNEQNVILETNLTAVTLLGVSRDTLVKQPLTRFIEPEDQDIFYQCRRLLFVSRQPQVCELRMIRRSASDVLLWVRIQVAVRPDTENQALIYHAILSDVSGKKLVEKNLRQSEEQFRAVTESAHDSIFLINSHSRITYWNHAAEILFGFNAGEILGKPLKMVLSDRFYRADQTRIERLEVIDEKQWVGKIVELYGLKKDGVEFPMELSLAQWFATGETFFTATVRDITLRKRAEENAHFLAEVNDVLAASLDYEATLTSIARLAVPRIADWCAVYITLEDGTIQQLVLTHVDPAKVEQAHELTRRYLDDPTAPYSVPNVIQTGKPELAPPFTREPSAVSGDAGLKTSPDSGLKSLMVVPLIAPGRIFGAITFFSAESGRFYGQADLALAQDLARRAALAVDNARLYQTAQSLNQELDQRVTRRTQELERANQQLRLLAAHIQSAREEERIKIARSIHDELGTLMTAIKMDLVFLGREISGTGPSKAPEALRAEISATTKLVDDAIQVVHLIARELRPGVLDHLGLRAALEWQLQEFQERAKIQCEFNSDLDTIAIDAERSTAVFRIMQETLTNVMRHAQATLVRVKLRREEQTLILEVRDNGIGISDSLETNRFGILGMRERAHVFGGDVMFQGAPGQGTIVTVRIPV